MKLYIYDHCPYCVRARMIFGLKKIPVDLIILANDDDDTPKTLIGRKAVPILADSEGMVMPESLDIVQYIDQHFPPICLKEYIRSEIKQWIETVTSYYNHLLMPRFIQIGLAEFTEQSAIDYFVNKKSKIIGSFEQNLLQTELYLTRINQDLQQLNSLILSPKSANIDLSLEDILLFPILRNLTIVKGIQYPNKVSAYLHKMALQTGIDLYLDRSI